MKKKKEKSKAPVIPEADIKFMDTLRRDIQTMGPLRSNHLNAFYKRHPEIPPKGSGAGTWIAKRCQHYGLIVKKPETYGGAMEVSVFDDASGDGTDVIARAVPVGERSRAVAFVFNGFNVGSVLGLSLAPLIIENFGWRSVFVAFGGLGIFWVAWVGMGIYPRGGALAHLVGRQ